VKTIIADICVLGAGPAGASAAYRLAQLGHDVVLVGAELPHRRNLPESVSPGFEVVLSQLGLRNKLDTFSVECESPEIRWEFADPIKNSAIGAFARLADRPRLDALLLDNARHAGAKVIAARDGARSVRCNDGGWQVRFCSSDVDEVRAKYLVVATGRKRALAQGRRRIMPPLLALHARWHLPRAATARTSVEALPDGWAWSAPRADGSYCAVAFIDPQLRGRSGPRGIEAIYRAFISSTADIGPRLRGAQMDSLGACDASATVANEVIGSDWILVGDSAVALEPMSAQGIQVAIKLGCQGAVVAHSVICDKSRAPMAETFYREQCRAIAERHRRATTNFYASPKRFKHEPFWAKRAPTNNKPAATSVRIPAVSAKTLLRISSESSIREVPCLIGDRICLHAALTHPSFDSPVSHVGSVAVATLLAEAASTQTAGELCRLWLQAGLTKRPSLLLHWLLKNRILIPDRLAHSSHHRIPCNRDAGVRVG
jgi:flavin-dependent dehydrogenase